MSYSYRNTPSIRVSPMLSADNVIWALRTNGRQSPDYVRAVIRSYIDVKFGRGRQKWEIDEKLTMLEREFRQYPDEFQRVRAETGLPVSRVFPSSQLDMLRRTQTSTAPSRPSPTALSRTNTTNPRITAFPYSSTSTVTRRPTTTTTRPAPADDEELPPPPYARTDPEPEQTAMLEARLAAEAETNPNATYDPPHTAPPVSYPPASSSRPPQTVYPTPSNPPQRENSTPQRIPSDPELRQIWEESQFEEAKRLSIAAAREQKDLEEAMRLSLADAGGSGGGPSNQSMDSVSEEPGFRRASSYNPLTDALGERRRTSSDLPNGGGDVSSISADLAGLSMPGGYEFEQHEENLRQERLEEQRRQQQQQQQSQPHQQQQHHQQEHTQQPDQHSTQSPFYQPHHSAQQPMSLMDDNDDLPLAVALTPMKTGTVLKSKNPFLSAAEREEQSDALTSPQASASYVSPSGEPLANHPSGTPVQQHLSPPQTPLPASRQVSAQSLRDSPGSGYTSYYLTSGGSESPRANKPLPSPPGPGGIQPGSSPRVSQLQGQSQQPQSPSLQQSAAYNSPPGPPPPHLQISTPPISAQHGQPGTPGPQSGFANSPGQSNSYQAITPSQYPTRQGTSGQPPLPPRPENLRSPQTTTPGYFAAEQGQQIKSPTSSVPTSSFSLSTPQAGPTGPPPLPIRPAIHNGEDPLELLKTYDTIFLIDDSASMAGERWEQAKSAITGVAEIAAEYDDDGIDVYFLNSKRVGKELKTNEDVEDLFAGLTPRGPTPTGARMEAILRDYMSRLERSGLTSPIAEQPLTPGAEVKPINLIVVTDGAPSDDPESVIIAIAKRLDRGDYPISQIGIQFFQIGNDSEAREALQELDDHLAEKHGIRDMVDTVPYSGEAMNAELILKTLLGGINRRLDRRESR